MEDELREESIHLKVIVCAQQAKREFTLELAKRDFEKWSKLKSPIEEEDVLAVFLERELILSLKVREL